MNQDLQQTQEALHQAGLSLHRLFDRHEATVGRAVQPEFGAIYDRAAVRLEMLTVIHARLYGNSIALNAVDKEFGARFPNADTEPPPMGPEFADFEDRIYDLYLKIELDYDSMLVFGSLLLDDWALLVAIAQGLDRSQANQFEMLLNLLQGPQCPRSLLTLRESPQNGTGSYLCIAVRAFRNKLLIHPGKPLKRNMRRHATMPFVFIRHQVPEAILPIPETVEGDMKLVHKMFGLRVPEGGTAADLAAWLVGQADSATTQNARQTIIKFVETYGVQSPIFQVVFQRLAAFIKEASALI